MDLFHRVTADMTADGTAKGAFLSDPEFIADVNATVDWLLAHPAGTNRFGNGHPPKRCGFARRNKDGRKRMVFGYRAPGRTLERSPLVRS